MFVNKRKYLLYTTDEKRPPLQGFSNKLIDYSV